MLLHCLQKGYQMSYWNFSFSLQTCFLIICIWLNYSSSSKWQNFTFHLTFANPLKLFHIRGKQIQLLLQWAFSKRALMSPSPTSLFSYYPICNVQYWLYLCRLVSRKVGSLQQQDAFIDSWLSKNQFQKLQDPQ